MLTEPLKIVIALVVPFLLTLLPQVRNQILAALPASLILILASLELAVIAGLVVYIHNLRKERNKLKERFDERANEAKPVHMFGVGWDKTLNPICPVCNTPLSSTYQGVAAISVSNSPAIGGNPRFQCLKCRSTSIELIDEHGKELTLIEAKKRVSEAISAT